jgi:DNA repair exonuclease SbcCD ATPase subunit
MERQIESLKAEYKAARKAVTRTKRDLINAEDELGSWREARKIIQTAAQQVQQQAHEKIAGVVSTCLSLVFDEPYTFKIDFKQSRGGTQALLLLERNGYEISGLDGVGGGIIDVVSFALRLSSIMLVKPAARKICVLDEPFKHLSKEYRPNIRELLSKLSQEMGIQFIMVTHDPTFMIGKVIEL